MRTIINTNKRVTGLENEFGSKAQEMVSKLKEEVQGLREEIIRTRYALEQRNELLRDCVAPEIK